MNVLAKANADKLLQDLFIDSPEKLIRIIVWRKKHVEYDVFNRDNRNLEDFVYVLQNDPELLNESSVVAFKNEYQTNYFRIGLVDSQENPAKFELRYVKPVQKTGEPEYYI